MASKRLFIFPCNSNGIEALDCVDGDEYEFVGFIDDDRVEAARKNAGHLPRSVLADHPTLTSGGAWRTATYTGSGSGDRIAGVAGRAAGDRGASGASWAWRVDGPGTVW